MNDLFDFIDDPEPARVPAIQVQPIELASEGLIQLWREAARSDLATILLPKAIKTLSRILDDDSAPAAARVSAAKTVLGVALSDPDQSLVKKTLSEMSADEITRAMHAIRQEIDVRQSGLTDLTSDVRQVMSSWATPQNDLTPLTLEQLPC